MSSKTHIYYLWQFTENYIWRKCFLSKKGVTESFYFYITVFFTVERLGEYCFCSFSESILLHKHFYFSPKKNMMSEYVCVLRRSAQETWHTNVLSVLNELALSNPCLRMSRFVSREIMGAILNTLSRDILKTFFACMAHKKKEFYIIQKACIGLYFFIFKNSKTSYNITRALKCCTALDVLAFEMFLLESCDIKTHPFSVTNWCKQQYTLLLFTKWSSR